MNRPVHILILSDDAARVRQWADALANDARVWQAAMDVPPDAAPDVVVMDATAASGERLPGDLPLQRWQAAEIGVVAMGENPSADVLLPPDFTLRELQLACRLLAEAVRWRRECHRARQLQLTYSQLALTDALTGLPNRRAWEKEAWDRSAHGKSDSRPICLALFDVDHFKSINDRFGHIAGDEILCHVGRRLAWACQDTDFVARLGGDEFALLLDDRNPAEAAADVESLRATACQGTPHAQVTACMGFACSQTLPQAGLDSLFEAADIALRVAKLSGRNRTVPADGCAACGRA
jgi:diguanylate cyclase (GGDEF)-like protein